MEDLKAYIESGVLELYVLGDLTGDEKIEAERMLKKYPELMKELGEIEGALQKYAETYSIEPSEGSRSKILSSLTGPENDKEAKVVLMEPVKSQNFYKYAFAASVALLLLSVISLINLNSQLKESNNQVAILQQSNERFSSRVNYVEDQLQDAKQSLDVFHQPDKYALVNLKGTPNAPTTSLMVAYSSEKSEIMLDLASLKMPVNDTEHQYQLWAMVDGKPVDLGVFDVKSDTSGMIKMKSLNKAQAFAVTLEPRGGSINPTMEKLMAMGAI
ncbi:MAG: anti-sigma factor [Pyrinomonadaceae bacterium]|nr:anti-sigma factor [Sphingobacteriaceae bacterium]